MRSRTDRDSLGKVRIPADAYYGPFTGRAIKQYHVTGNTSHPYLVKAFVMIKRSASIANMKKRILDKKRGKAIVSACEIACEMDSTVASMLITTPLRSPREGDEPTPTDDNWETYDRLCPVIDKRLADFQA